MSHSSIPASASKEEGEHGKYSEPEDLQEGKLNELESSSDSENDSEMERFQPNTEGIYNDSETKQVLQEMDQVVEDLEKWKQRRREALNADKQSLSAKERQSNTTAYSTTNVSATTGPTQSIESRYNTASKHSMESISRLAATTQDSSLQRQRIGARIPFDKQNALKSEKQLKSYRGSSNIDDEITELRAKELAQDKLKELGIDADMLDNETRAESYLDELDGAIKEYEKTKKK